VTAKQQEFQRRQAFCGVEAGDAPSTAADEFDAVMELKEMRLGDTLSSDGQQLTKANLIVTVNPPYRRKVAD